MAKDVISFREEITQVELDGKINPKYYYSIFKKFWFLNVAQAMYINRRNHVNIPSTKSATMKDWNDISLH